jgi:hypothetical protein
MSRISARTRHLQVERFNRGQPLVNPKFRIVRESIQLIPRGIAQDSLCSYWEHTNQFEGPGLHWRRRCQLSEGGLGWRLRFVR